MAINTSADMAAAIRAQLQSIVTAKAAALAKVAEVIAAGAGPTYTITDAQGSHTIDMAGYLRVLNEQVKSYGELEKSLLETLQDLTPYRVNQYAVIGGRPWQC